MDKTGKPTKDTQPSDALSFGMVDLASGGDEGEDKPLTVDRMPAQKAAAPSQQQTGAPQHQAPDKKNVPAAVAPAGKSVSDRQPQQRPPSRYDPVTVSSPPLVSSKTLKLFLLVALVLAILAGGVFGFLKWREHVRQQEIQEKENLDSRSLDSLRDQALRTDGLK